MIYQNVFGALYGYKHKQDVMLDLFHLILY